ncbi:MAG: hypothetical protein J7K71_03480 [Candidatus Omnitrophica bacterium]|nr:hypothetical protein [Candidatus Omnitrophota bacterium]
MGEVEKKKVKYVQIEKIIVKLNRFDELIDKLKKGIDELREETREVRERMKWLEFGFNTFCVSSAITTELRRTRPKKLSPSYVFLGDGINSTRVESRVEPII